MSGVVGILPTTPLARYALLLLANQGKEVLINILFAIHCFASVVGNIITHGVVNLVRRRLVNCGGGHR